MVVAVLAIWGAGLIGVMMIFARIYYRNKE